MINGIGRTHKLGKQNRQLPVVTNGNLNIVLLNSNMHDKSNENIDVASKEPITVDKYFIPSNGVIHTMDDFILIKLLSIPHTTNMSDMDVAVDEKSQYFATTRKKMSVPLDQALIQICLSRVCWYMILFNVNNIPQ